MSVDEIYKLMQYAVAKNLQQGYLSPDDFNRTINMAQNSYMEYLLGQYQKYMPLRPISTVQLGNNERVRQSIAPLIYGTILSIDGQGVAPFPVYFEYTDQIWSIYGVYNIQFVEQNKLSSHIHSVIDPIEENPVYIINTDGYKFYPNNIGQANLSYVRTPPAIIWNYTVDVNGIPEYNPSTSHQPVWTNSDIMNIIVRALQMVGVSLQLGVVIQYSEAIKNGGS